MYLLACYFPRDTPINSGPTEILSGSQFYHDLRCETHRRICERKFEEKLISEWDVKPKAFGCPAGTFVFIHLDTWHRGSRNLSGLPRHMMKFVFQRVTMPKKPTWDFKNPRVDWSLFHGAALRSNIYQCTWNWMQGAFTPTQDFAFEQPLTLNGEAKPILKEESVPLQLNWIYELGTSSSLLTLAQLLKGKASEGKQTVLESFQQQNAIYGFIAAGPPSVPILLQILQDPTSDHVAQRHTFYGLGFILSNHFPKIPENIFKLFLEFLKNTHSRVRASAVECFGWLDTAFENITTPDFQELILDQISEVAQSDTSDLVRITACCTLLKLSRFGTLGRVVTRLILVIESDESRYAVAYAMEALKRIGSPEAMSSYIRKLEISEWCHHTTRYSGY